MNDEQLDLLLNYDYTEIEKIPSQISNIDETIKAILQELQKEEELEIVEPTPFEMKVLEAIEKDSEIESADTETINESLDVLTDMTDDLPEEETLVEDETLLEEPVEEEPVDYLQLIYEEMQKDDEQAILMNESLETIVEQNNVAAEIDSMQYTYMIFIIPALFLAVLISKLMKASIG